MKFSPRDFSGPLRGTILAMLACVVMAGPAPARDTQIVTLAGKRQMLANPGTDLVGAGKPDVIVVEYFDYNCGYCKQLVPTLRALLAQDSHLAILYKDWPIFGEVSSYASASALAARWQGKYLIAHDALMGGPHLDRAEQVDAVLQGAGVNMEILKKDRAAHAREIAALLERNDEEAQALTFEGTPGLVIGRQLVPGIAGLSDLKRLVANSRREP